MYIPDDPSRYEEVRVSPMYLAGSSGSGEVGFAPIAHWPHHHLDDGPCQLVVASPDQRIRVGWFGDDFELWKITAAAETVAAPRWTATFNHVTPAEIVAGLTTALARDYAEADPNENNGRFLAKPSIHWTDAVQPLLDAGWDRKIKYGIVEITAPDGLAGAEIDILRGGLDAKSVMLWAGPPGWGTRAEAVFTARTPSHLIAATAAVMAESAPVIRERHQIQRRLTHLVTLTPVGQVAAASQVPRAPTPLEVRRTAVVQAVHRAAGSPRTPADLRVTAARSRTTGMPQNPTSAASPPGTAAPPTGASAPRRSR